MGKPVVTVKKSDVLPFCTVKPVVAGGRKAVVCSVVNCNALILAGVIIIDSTAFVCGAVIDKDYLKVTVGLGDDAVEALGEIFFNVVDGDDDGNHNLCFYIFSMQ